MLIEKEISVDEYLALNDYTLFCFLNSIRKIKIDDLLDYLAEAFEFGKGFDYMSFEEFNIKYGNKTFENDKYTFRIKPISQKKRCQYFLLPYNAFFIPQNTSPTPPNAPFRTPNRQFLSCAQACPITPSHSSINAHGTLQ